jgi:hypothetical protein
VELHHLDGRGRDFEEIEPELFRFPAINSANLRRRVEEAFASGI